MDQNYFGPTREAVEHLNRVLELQATGQEQDWELELSDPAKLNRMLQLLEDDELHAETKKALVALILHTAQEAYDSGIAVDGAVRSLSVFMKANPDVRTSLATYWARYDPVLAVFI